MNNWAFWLVFVATLISVVGWSYFLWREHDASKPVELSQFASRSATNARYYRTLMWLCPTLFASTAIWYVAPRLDNFALILLWLDSCTCCMLAGVFLPRGGREEMLHNIFAYTMGVAMLGLALVSVFVMPKHTLFAGFIAAIMTTVAIIGPRHRRYYVFYELGFIFLSHFSMIAITLAVT